MTYRTHLRLVSVISTHGGRRTVLTTTSTSRIWARCDCGNSSYPRLAQPFSAGWYTLFSISSTNPSITPKSTPRSWSPVWYVSLKRVYVAFGLGWFVINSLLRREGVGWLHFLLNIYLMLLLYPSLSSIQVAFPRWCSLSRPSLFTGTVSVAGAMSLSLTYDPSRNQRFSVIHSRSEYQWDLFICWFVSPVWK